MATQVNYSVRRGNGSRIANQLAEKTFNSIKLITVGQNAPARNSGFFVYEIGAGRSVEDVLTEIDSTSFLVNATDVKIWIKTATLGGCRKVYLLSK